jgi:hypothetical protein
MHVTQTSEKQSQTEQPESPAPSKKSSRKSILAFAVFALGINTATAIHTMSPSGFALPNIGDFALPDISSLAELLPHQKASDPIPDPAVAALKDIQSAQQQYVAALQANNLLLQQNTDIVRQDSIALASLRQSVVDEQVGVKKISAQIADEHEDVKKISAISARRAQNRQFRAMRKKMARQSTPVGPISLGGAPLSLPATTPTPQS